MSRRSPLASAVVVLSLALGISANTAVFSFVNAIQFKPLPFRDEARLMDIHEWSATELCAGCAVGTSYPGFRDWQGQARSFESLAAYVEGRYIVSGGTGPERIGGAAISAGLFPTIGVQPSLGRAFTADDDRAGAPPTVVIGDLLWRRRFGGNPSILEETVRVNGIARTIVGVMPAGFGFPEVAQLWIPLAPEARDWKRSDRSLAVVGRLRQGVTIKGADAEARTLAAAMERQYPATNGRWTARVTTLREDMTGETATASIVLLSAVAFVLLIACANVANLLLARASERRREIAIRFALGATRARVARLVLMESLGLSAVGGGIGLLVALWASRAIVTAMGSMEAPYWIRFGIDWRVLAFCAAVTVATGALCGIVPAWHASGANPYSALKDGGAVAGGPRGRRVRTALVVSQLALALLLLAGAGLLIKTVAQTFAFDPGYDPARVLAGDIDLAGPRYGDPRQVRALVDGIIDRLERIPRVRAAVSRTIFFGGFGGQRRLISVEGLTAVPDGGSPTFYYAVSPGYFRTLGMAMGDGREFDRSDRAGVAIVNEEMARRLWPGESALGHRIRFGDDPSNAPWQTVIGVVSNAGGTPMAGARPSSIAYVPFVSDAGRTFAIMASTPGDPAALATEVRAAVRELDPDQPVEDLQTMAEMLAAWTQPARFVALLMGSLAAVALLLASVGTYGVIAYGVSQRTREIGIRLALGASPRQVQALMARSGLRMTLGGIAIGVPAALVSTRALEGILSGTSPTDPAVFAAVTATLAAVALLASWLPARRAARVDPLTVLRAE
jgi:putative ABC transport system permease protein